MGYFGEDEEDEPVDGKRFKLTRRNRGPQGLEVRMQRLEDELLESNLEILMGASMFGHPGAQDNAPPAAWVEEFGEDHAKELQMYAKLAMLPAREAPIGLTMARQTAMGILAARARKKSAAVHYHMNVSMVMPPPTNQRKVIDVESG